MADRSKLPAEGVQLPGRAKEDTITLTLPGDGRRRFLSLWPQLDEPEASTSTVGNGNVSLDGVDAGPCEQRQDDGKRVERSQQMYDELEILLDERISNQRRKLAAEAEAAKEGDELEGRRSRSKRKREDEVEEESKLEGQVPDLLARTKPKKVQPQFQSSRSFSVNNGSSSVSETLPRGRSNITEQQDELSSEEDNPTMSSSIRPQNETTSVEQSKCYVAMYAKPSTRKHKVMESDGFIIVSGKNVKLKNSEGEVIASSNNFTLTDEMLTEDKIFKLGGKEVQIVEQTNKPLSKPECQLLDLPVRTKSKVQPQPSWSFSANKGSSPVFEPPPSSRSHVTEQQDEFSSEEDNPTMSSSSIEAQEETISIEQSKCYVAMYAKPSTRKHKVMESDGFIIVSGKNVKLKDSEGEVIASSNNFTLTDEMLTEDKIFKLGGKEVQIVERTENPLPKPEGQLQDLQVRAKPNSVSSSSIGAQQETISVEQSKCYVAMYAKPSTRKHKVMESDGFIIVSGKNVKLKNSEGDVIESSNNFTLTEEMLTEDKIFKLGGKEVQIVEPTNNPFGEEATFLTIGNAYRWNP